MAKKKTSRELSQIAKRGWITRRANLQRIQLEGINRRAVGRWYQKQLDIAVEREVKKALDEERKRAHKELERERKRLAKQVSPELAALRKENRRLKAKLRRAEKREKEKDEIANSPRKYIEKKMEWLWDQYGRDGGHEQIKRWIGRMAKRFGWPQDDLWHWYFSPTW